MLINYKINCKFESLSLYKYFRQIEKEMAYFEIDSSHWKYALKIMAKPSNFHV